MRSLLVILLATLVAVATHAQDILPGRGSRRGAGGEETLARLRRTSLDVAWTDRELRDCAADLGARAGVNVLLSGGAREKEFLIARLELRRVSALLLVQLLAEEAGLVARFESNLVILETPAESVRRTATLAVYDLGSRFYRPPDFPAPRIGIRPTSAADFEDEIRPEPADLEQIVAILRSATGEAGWEIEGTSMQIANRRLIVRHTPAMQARVARLLDALSACY